jgi:hypothetical protein
MCAECGTHQKSGVNANTIQTARKAGQAGQASLVAGIVSVVCGLVWAGLAIFAQVELGILAWGIGFVTGGCVMVMTNERSGRTGMAAAGLALFGLLIGKALTFQFGVIPMAAKELSGEKEYLAMYMADDVAAEQLIAWSAEGEDPEDFDPDPDAIVREAEERVNQMSPDERRGKARELAEVIVGEMTLGEKASTVLDFMDIVWALFAVGSAFKLAAGEDG